MLSSKKHKIQVTIEQQQSCELVSMKSKWDKQESQSHLCLLYETRSWRCSTSKPSVHTWRIETPQQPAARLHKAADVIGFCAKNIIRSLSENIGFLCLHEQLQACREFDERQTQHRWWSPVPVATTQPTRCLYAVSARNLVHPVYTPTTACRHTVQTAVLEAERSLLRFRSSFHIWPFKQTVTETADNTDLWWTTRTSDSSYFLNMIVVTDEALYDFYKVMHS